MVFQIDPPPSKTFGASWMHLLITSYKLCKYEYEDLKYGFLVNNE